MEAGLARNLAAEIAADERRAVEARKGSRTARGCSSVVSGVAALLFGLVAFVMVVEAKAPSPALIAGMLMMSAMAGMFGFITVRWVRGLPPRDFDAPVLPTSERELLEPRGPNAPDGATSTTERGGS